jgi:hypothetical protein
MNFLITKQLLFDYYNKPSQFMTSRIIQNDLYDYADDELIDSIESVQSKCKTIYKEGEWFTKNSKLYSNVFPIQDIKQIEKCYDIQRLKN